MNPIRSSFHTTAFIATTATLFLLAPLARALPTDSADSRVTSPEISPDRKVTFRLLAPGASQVRITGDFALNGTPMSKGQDGVWSLTTDPLKPSIYGYSFNVDGVRITDPGNLFVTSGATHLKSYVLVPGDKDHPEAWEIRDVPHGNLHEHFYKSPELGDRHLIVYTPPGYDPAAAKTYPVIYLFHTDTDNETFWFQMGRANLIMDNLIADHKASPAIVVSCFGWPAAQNPGPEYSADGVMAYVDKIDKETVADVIPLIDKEYRTAADAKDRAILGLSALGGCQALTIGLNNPGTFAYVAGFSSGFRQNQDLDANFKGLLADLPKSKTAFKRVLIKVGENEGGNSGSSQLVDRYLTSKAIPHDLIVQPGGTHSWVSWREYFRDFMTEIFKD